MKEDLKDEKLDFLFFSFNKCSWGGEGGCSAGLPGREITG